MFGLDLTHIIVLLILGVLLFGKRLPEVAKSVGKTLIEIKKGLGSLESSLESGDFTQLRADPPPPPPPVRPPQRVARSAQSSRTIQPPRPRQSSEGTDLGSIRVQHSGGPRLPQPLR